MKYQKNESKACHKHMHWLYGWLDGNTIEQK